MNRVNSHNDHDVSTINVVLVLLLLLVSNSEVLSRVMEDRCIVNTTTQREYKWLGHVLHHDVLLRDILEGRMLGKRTRGRKRLQLMGNICYEGTSCRSVKNQNQKSESEMV